MPSYKQRRITEWLAALFDDRTNVPAGAALKKGLARGFTTGALLRARRQLGVVSVRIGGGWVWVYVKGGKA